MLIETIQQGKRIAASNRGVSYLGTYIKEMAEARCWDDGSILF